MVSTTDVNGLRRKLDRERFLLRGAYRTGGIFEADYEPIRAFGDHREVNDAVAVSTILGDVSNLRRCSQRSPTALVDFDSVRDATRVLKINQSDHGISDASNNNYRKALRLFFRWLDEDREAGDYPWWEDVRVPGVASEPIDPNEALSIEEVRELRAAATRPRDKALIEFLADTGLRIAAALQLRRRDVEGLDTPWPTVTVNRDAIGQKGMDPLPRPIIQSAEQLRIYLNEYHPDDHPDAPVFAAMTYAHRNRDNGAISPSTTLKRLKNLARTIGIDPDRVQNHAFRHVATTRMRRDMDMDWDDIAHRTGWSAQSLSRMKDLYGHLTNEDKNDRVWAAAGKARTDDGEKPEASLDVCAACGRDIDGGARYCPSCGADQEADYLDGETRRALAELPPGVAVEIRKAIDAAESDPEGREALRGE